MTDVLPGPVKPSLRGRKPSAHDPTSLHHLHDPLWLEEGSRCLGFVKGHNWTESDTLETGQSGLSVRFPQKPLWNHARGEANECLKLGQGTLLQSWLFSKAAPRLLRVLSLKLVGQMSDVTNTWSVRFLWKFRSELLCDPKFHLAE